MRQDDITVVRHTNLYLLFAHKQLCQHHAGQCHLLIFTGVTNPVDTIQSAKDYRTVLTGQDGARIELVALQTVTDIIVVKSIVERAVLVVALNDNTTQTVSRSHPNVVVLIFSNAADGVIAQTVFLQQVSQFIVHLVENVQTFSCSNPQQSAGVFKNLRDKVVGEGHQVRTVSR